MAYQMGKQRRMRKNSYELSFSPEFFFAEGEPYDYLGDTKRPVSVWAAVEGMRLHNPEQWAELAKEVFGLDNPEYLTSETVMDKIQETNTCGTLSSPVDVYIDPEGWFSVDVYDEMSRNGGARRQRRNPSFNLKKYGEQMLQWHSGMDAIYAVGSFAMDGKVHPDPEVIRRALILLESYSHSNKFPPRDRREAADLANQTRQLIGAAREPGELDPFTRGYLEAALFSTNDESDESGGEPLDKNYSVADFAPEAIEEAVADCTRFQEQNSADLEGFDEAEAGADFWFTRCGHGVGYWDGDYPEPQATRLTNASKKFGEVWLTVGDDGQIYSS